MKKSAMFPKLWNAIEIDLKETKSVKICNQRVVNIYLEHYERFKREKVVYHVSRFYKKAETLLDCLCLAYPNKFTIVN